jgi:hypothetical protein
MMANKAVPDSKPQTVSSNLFKARPKVQKLSSKKRH